MTILFKRVKVFIISSHLRPKTIVPMHILNLRDEKMYNTNKFF